MARVEVTLQLLHERPFCAAALLSGDGCGCGCGCEKKSGSRRRRKRSREEKEEWRRQRRATIGPKPAADDDECGCGGGGDNNDVMGYVIREAARVVERQRKARAARMSADELAADDVHCSDAVYRNTALNSMHYGVAPTPERIAAKVAALRKRDEGLVDALEMQAAIEQVLVDLGLGDSAPPS